jgi:hypothetical protein
MGEGANFNPEYVRWSEAQFWADPRVSAMSPLERHLYRALLLAAFRCESRPYLPAEEFKLAALADAPSVEIWRQCQEAVLACFTLGDCGYASDYVLAEYARSLAETGHPPRRRRAAKPLPKGAPAGFEDFWREYPRRVCKAVALRAWRKLNPSDALRLRIMEALAEHKQLEQWQKDNGRFIPHPATWLNQARWEDELPCPRRTHLPSLF